MSSSIMVTEDDMDLTKKDPLNYRTTQPIKSHKHKSKCGKVPKPGKTNRNTEKPVKPMKKNQKRSRNPKN